jgi:hypothetical protein
MIAEHTVEVGPVEFLPALATPTADRTAPQAISIASGATNVGDVVDSPVMYDHIERIAKMIAFNRFCPAHLAKGNTPEQIVATCFRIAAQAVRWKVDPFALADETYEVRGKLGYQGKLVASIINARAGLDGRLDYTFTGTGDDLAVTVTGKFKSESTPRTVTASLKQSRTDNDMWKRDPEQKLCYVGAIKWGRRHCPEILTGVLTTEDLDVIAAGEAPAPESEELKAARAAEAREAQRRALAAVAAPFATTTTSPASPAPAAEATTAPATPTATVGKTLRTITTTTPVDEPTKAKVRAAWKKLGKPDTEFGGLLAPYEKAKLSELTQLQADDLLGRLLAMSPAAGKDSARNTSESTVAQTQAGVPSTSGQAGATTEGNQAGEQPSHGGSVEAPSVVLPDDPFAALEISHGTSSAKDRERFQALAKELKWDRQAVAFLKKNHAPTVHQLSAYGVAKGLRLLELVKAKGEEAVNVAAEKTFGEKSLYEYTGAELKYLAGVLESPF